MRVSELSEGYRKLSDLVAEGLGNQEIHVRLGLSEHTVKNYLYTIFQKLDITSRTQLAKLVLEEKLQKEKEGAVKSSSSESVTSPLSILIEQGRKNREVAVTFEVREGRIKKYLSGILSELGCSDRTELTLRIRLKTLPKKTAGPEPLPRV